MPEEIASRPAKSGSARNDGDLPYTGIYNDVFDGGRTRVGRNPSQVSTLRGRQMFTSDAHIFNHCSSVRAWARLKTSRGLTESPLKVISSEIGWLFSYISFQPLVKLHLGRAAVQHIPCPDFVKQVNIGAEEAETVIDSPMRRRRVFLLQIDKLRER